MPRKPRKPRQPDEIDLIPDDDLEAHLARATRGLAETLSRGAPLMAEEVARQAGLPPHERDLAMVAGLVRTSAEVADKMARAAEMQRAALRLEQGIDALGLSIEVPDYDDDGEVLELPARAGARRG